MFSLARTLFSPGSAEDRSSLFVWFIDSMVRSDSSRACASAFWLCAFADRPRSLSGRGAPEVSRFSCMLFLSVRGFSDYAGPTSHSRLAWLSCCLPPLGKESASCSIGFSKLNTQPTYTPVYASRYISRCTTQNSGPSGSLLLPRRTLASPTTCRLLRKQ